VTDEFLLAHARNLRAGLQHASGYDDEVATIYNVLRLVQKQAVVPAASDQAGKAGDRSARVQAIKAELLADPTMMAAVGISIYVRGLKESEVSASGKAQAPTSRAPECAASNCGLPTDTIEAFRVIRDGERYDYCSVECAVSDAREIGRLEGIAESGKAQAEWIAVSERLPKRGEAVIAYDQFYGAIGEAIYWNGWAFAGERKDDCSVTHWQTLPPPPSSSTPGSSDG
jgi:hypothetical protein